MPQLNTATWSITIISMFISLFIILQLKISSFNYFLLPSLKSKKTKTLANPWETKWTKTYLPLSLPLH